MDQDATWYEGRPRAQATDVLLDGDPAPIPLKKRTQQLPHFSANIYCGETVAHSSNC